MAGIDIIVSAVDKASKTLEDIGSKGSQAAGGLEKNWLKVGIATAAFGVGLEALARKVAPMNEKTKQLSKSLDMQESEVRELALELSNVTFPLENVLALMESGRAQGLESVEALTNYANFWDMISDATGESSIALGEAGVALRAVGIDAGNESEALDAFGFVVRETNGSVSEFLQFLQKAGPELREMNIGVDEAAAILGTLERELGMSGRTARMEFRTAVSQSNGDLETLYNILGITSEQVGIYSQKVAESGNVIKEQAQINAESFTIMQKFQHAISELTYKYGDLIQSSSVLTPILIATGPILRGLIAIKNAYAGAAAKAAAANSTFYASFAVKFLPILAGVALAMVQTGDSMRYATENTDRLKQVIYDVEKGLQRYESAAKDAVALNVEMAPKELYEQNLELLKTVEGLSEKYPELVDKTMELENSYKTGEISLAEYNEAVKESIGLAEQNALSTENVTQKYASAEEAIEAFTQQNLEAGYEMEEAKAMAEQQARSMGYLADETDRVTRAFSELLEEIFGITNAEDSYQQAIWATQDAYKEYLESVKEHGEESREAEEATIRLNQARQDELSKLQNLYAEEGLSIERKQELKGELLLLLQQIDETSNLSQEKFIEMAESFGLNAFEIMNMADKMGIELDETAKERFIRMTLLGAEDVLNTAKKVKDYMQSLDGLSSSMRVNIIRQEQHGFSGGGYIMPQASSGMYATSESALPVMIHPPEIIANERMAMNLVWNMMNGRYPAKEGTNQSSDKTPVIIQFPGMVIKEEADIDVFLEKMERKVVSFMRGKGYGFTV